MTLANSSKFCNLMQLADKSIRSVMNLSTLLYKKNSVLSKKMLFIFIISTKFYRTGWPFSSGVS